MVRTNCTTKVTDVLSTIGISANEHAKTWAPVKRHRASLRQKLLEEHGLLMFP